MGMFDSVYIPCPKCGLRQEAQSKSGDCLLRVYSIEDVPEDVMWNINRHAPFKCEACGSLFEVELTYKTVLIDVE